jgi:Na+/H+-dicarboxylate symporter
MSVPEVPQRPEPPPVPPRTLGGCASVFIALIGVILLLPGICSLVFMVASMQGSGPPGGIVGLWLFTFLLATIGGLLIGYAIRGR